MCYFRCALTVVCLGWQTWGADNSVTSLARSATYSNDWVTVSEEGGVMAIRGWAATFVS